MKIKKVEVGFGVSLCVRDNTWIKANAGMEVELDQPNDTTDDAYEGSWNRVVTEVNKQLNNFDINIMKKPQ